MLRRTNWKKLIIGLIIAGALAVALYSSTFDSLPQAAYRLFDQIAAPNGNDRLMVIAPHQDDEVLGAGDYIQQAVAAGAKVEVVFATDGNKHGKKAIRHDEALAADKKLGLASNQLVFFDFPDGNLSGQNQYNQFVVRLTVEIKSFVPTIIITTLPEDEHPDHAACGRAVRTLSPDITSARQLFFLVHADRYPRPIGDKPNRYLLPPLKLMTAYDWQVFSPSPIEQLQKRQAINAYSSQLSLANPILRQLLLSFDRQNELFAQTR